MAGQTFRLAQTVSSQDDTAMSQVMPQDAPVQEWEKRLREIDIELDSDLMGEIAATVSDDQIRDALDKLATLQTDSSLLLGRTLLQRWAANAPTDAARWIAILPDNDFGHMAFKEVMISWAEKDMAKAVTWIEQLPENGNKAAAQLSVGAEAATQKKTATAITLVAGLPPGPERDELLNYSVLQWAVTDGDSAVAWAIQVPDTTMREKMLADIAVGLGVQDPFRAAGFIAHSMTDSAVWSNALMDVVRFWTASAPDQAVAWVEHFPVGPLRVAAMANVQEVLAKRNSSIAVGLDRISSGGSSMQPTNKM